LAGHGIRDIGVLKQAFAELDNSVLQDSYGRGGIIEDFQAEMAEVLGKEAAVFFPSGTMAQQIALRLWSDRLGTKRVAYHPLCHLEIHEEDGLKELHGLQPTLLGAADRLITLADVEAMEGPIACLLLELPQREIGGQLPPYEELEAIAAHCRARGIRLHLDGARLFEALPYYGRTAAEVCSLFDSVYISFYKGIGAVAGAILAGSADFTEASKIWKRRHGGDLFSLYPYIVPARYYYRERVGRMERYYREACELAARFNGCRHITTLPVVPVSNLFHVHFALSSEAVAPALIEVAEQIGLVLTWRLKALAEIGCSFELNVGDLYATIPAAVLDEAFALLDERLAAAADQQG
jgi:threonine aldolase